MKIMARSARATYKRMLEVLDGSTKPGDIDKLKGLRDITYALEFTLLYCSVYKSHISIDRAQPH